MGRYYMRKRNPEETIDSADKIARFVKERINFEN